MTITTVDNRELVVTINETSAYNGRIRKPRKVYALIYDKEHNLLDVIMPDIQATHKQAKEWAEYRAQTIPNEYPEAAQVEIINGELSAEEIVIITYTPKEDAEPTFDDRCNYSVLADAINKGTIVVNVVSVARSGLSRKFRFYAVDKDGYLSLLNAIIANLLGMKLDKAGNYSGSFYAEGILQACADHLQDKNFDCEFTTYQKI